MNSSPPVVKRDKDPHFWLMVTLIIAVVVSGVVVYAFALMDSMKQGTLTPDQIPTISKVNP